MRLKSLFFVVFVISLIPLLYSQRKSAMKKRDTANIKFSDYVLRGSLSESYKCFMKSGKGRVAFMGGSVTTRRWRLDVQKYLKQKFSQKKFDFIMAGIGGTTADLGAFRLPTHVFKKGKVDLFFLEFAVNGGGVRAMEGIVRQAKKINPHIDIVIMYLANKRHSRSFNNGEIPKIVQNHEKVAKHYDVSALFLYREIARRVKEGKITWEEFSKDNVHPKPFGCRIYGQCIIDFLEDAWKKIPIGKLTKKAKLPQKLDPYCYENGRFIEPEAVKLKGFKLVKKWTTDERTCNFRPPVKLLEAKKPGDELSLTFTGTAVGIYIIGGKDNGILEYSIDDAPFKRKRIYDRRFHLPRHKIFASNLKAGKHKIVLRVARKKNKNSTGYAARILKFMVN